ncbi:hypothetical protein LSCM1_07747 [Leishmania martiniquensis]|uniref:Uncharacterized protein n=1 Tax=Leishmania martiniquensis TaxID=1580590 RepID=A0A836GS10_9TRYP|nr:hypothetical protein LSCM1_07747 [Leishmania martiniquensis]
MDTSHPTNVPQVPGGGGAPLPPGAHFTKVPPLFRRVSGASGIAGPLVAVAPPGFRMKVPPTHMLMMAGNKKMLMPPQLLPASGGGHLLAASPPLSRSTSPGTTTSQPGPPGRRSAGTPPQYPQFAFVHGKKMMVPPGTKLPMGHPGTNTATGATAFGVAPRTAMDSAVRMTAPEQSWMASPRSSLAASPPPGTAASRGAVAATVGGVGRSPSSPRRNLGESPVRPSRQATAVPSPPHPATAAAAGATDKKRHKSGLMRSLTGAINFLKGRTLWEGGGGGGAERQPGRNAATPQQQPQRVPTPPGPATRGENVGRSHRGPDNSTLMPNSHSPPPTSEQPPQKTPQFPHPQQSMSSSSAAAASSPRKMPPGNIMAMKGPPGGGGIAMEPKKVIRAHPPPDAVRSRASSLERPSRSGSASPPLFMAPPPAVAAATNVLRVPSSTVLKEQQLPEAGVRSPGHRRRELGEGSDESDSVGRENGAHASAQEAAPSHIRVAGHPRDSPEAVAAHDAVGSGRAQSSGTPQRNEALHEKERVRPPEPRVHSHDSGGGDDKNGSRHPAGVMMSETPATGAAATATSPPSTARCDSDSKTSAATALGPVRQTATTSARSAAAATKRRQEEERLRLLEEAHKGSLESKKLRGVQSKSAPRAAPASQPQPASAAQTAQEPRSPQEEDNTQKPASVECNSHSIVSTLSHRSLLTLCGSSASLSGEEGRARSPKRGGGRAGDRRPPACAGPDSARSRERKGEVGRAGSSDAQRGAQPQQKRRGRQRSARRSIRKRDGGSSDSSDVDSEEDGASSFEALTSRDLYRLAKMLRDSNTSSMGTADIDGRQRRGSRRRLHRSPESGCGRATDTDSGDDGSWDRHRQQYNHWKRRSTLPITTVGIPWRYVGTRRSLEPFASPPRVRRPLGYINVGGGRYARVGGGSPYARHRIQPRAMSIGPVPLDAAGTRPWARNARENCRYSSHSAEQSPGPSTPLDACRNAVMTEVQTSTAMGSRQASSSRGGSGAAAVYYRGHQRPLFSGRGSDDTLLSAADSQHPYCVSASALVPVTQPTSTRHGSTSAAYEHSEQQCGGPSSVPGTFRWAPAQPNSSSHQSPPPASAAAAATGRTVLGSRTKYTHDPTVEAIAHDTAAAAPSGAGEAVRPASLRQNGFFHDLRDLLSGTLSARLSGGARSRSLSSHLRASSPSTQRQWRAQKQQRQAQGDTEQSHSCSAANNTRRAGGQAVAAAAATARGGSPAAYGSLSVGWSPPRKREAVCLSTPSRRRSSRGFSVDGSSSLTAQTCSKWLDEILAATTVTPTGVRTNGAALGSSGESAAAARSAIPVVDLRREFKPRIAGDDAGGRGSTRPASLSMFGEEVKDYTHEFTGSRARPHIPGVSFKHMIGARSATSSPPRTGGTALASGGAANVKSVNGVSEGLPFPAYSSIRIHDPMRKSPWALAPERKGLDVLPGRPALSRRRRIPVDEIAAAESGVTDPLGGDHPAEESDGTGGVLHRARSATHTIVEEVHLDEQRRPYLVVRPVLSSEEGKAQRAAMERLARPKPIYRRTDDPA